MGSEELRNLSQRWSGIVPSQHQVRRLCEFMLKRDLRFKQTSVAHLGEQFLAEDLCRRSIAEAFAGCVVQPVTDFDKVGIGHGQRIDLSR